MLSCEQFEILLADDIDGALGAPGRAEDWAAFEGHLASCAACASLARDARDAVAFMERAAEPDPPQALIGNILHATGAGWEFKLRGKGVRGWINRTFAPVLRPRIVMSAMMTLMSLTMLTHCTGAPNRPLTAADLDPVRLWTSLDDRTHRLWVRATKSYESMRLVYEIKSQLSEWKQQQADADEAAAEAKASSRKLDSKSVERKPQESQEKQQ